MDSFINRFTMQQDLLFIIYRKGYEKVSRGFIVRSANGCRCSNCEEISASIAEKIKNNGVDENSFQLNLVPSEQAEQGVAVKLSDRVTEVNKR